MNSNDIAILIRDAVTEFQAKRSNALAYTKTRRPWLNSQDEIDKHVKRVIERTEAAEGIRLMSSQLGELIANKQVFVICNNDAMLSAVLSEDAAQAEVARLRASQTDERFYYHYHEVGVI